MEDGSNEPAEETLDLLWGAQEIGKMIGRTPTQTFHMLRSGKLPAKQVGERWVASKAKLIAFFNDGVQ
ncbi:MAG: hypothetical protein DI629_02650 [Mesorhizobium amorphae]|nr:MAG: hypothetical protein DI629_02650 [Mesorhizobium amorphae]